jgi:hypothetical protein
MRANEPHKRTTKSACDTENVDQGGQPTWFVAQVDLPLNWTGHGKPLHYWYRGQKVASSMKATLARTSNSKPAQPLHLIWSAKALSKNPASKARSFSVWVRLRTRTKGEQPTCFVAQIYQREAITLVPQRITFTLKGPQMFFQNRHITMAWTLIIHYNIGS